MKTLLALTSTAVLLLAAVVANAQAKATAPPPDAVSTTLDVSQVVDRDGFDVFVSPAEVLVLQEGGAIVIDVRAPEEYAEAHIPGAISVPGDSLRTPSAKPGLGDSQYLFRDANGEADVATYEKILGDAVAGR